MPRKAERQECGARASMLGIMGGASHLEHYDPTATHIACRDQWHGKRFAWPRLQVI
jgi:hypothetical protein